MIFPASRGRFSFCVRWIDKYGRRHLCHGSKFTVLSMHGGYLAAEFVSHTSCCVGSLNNSGITVKECVGHSGLKSQSANISLGMRFEECRPRFVDGGWIRASFDAWQKSFHVLVNRANAKEKKPLPAGKL